MKSDKKLLRREILNFLQLRLRSTCDTLTSNDVAEGCREFANFHIYDI